MTRKQTSQANGMSARPASAQEWAQQAGLYLRAGQTAAQTRIAPLTASARTAAQQGIYGARVWTAPRLDLMGQTLQDRVAPRMYATLSAAARRIEPVEPAKTRRRRWPAIAAGVVVIAGGSAAVYLILNRRNAGAGEEMAEPGESAGSPDAAQDMAAPDGVAADGVGTEAVGADAAVGADVNGRTQAP